MVDVVARDRPGLQWALAAAIAASAASIRVARIATFGTRAHDAFYLVDADGRRLGAAARARLRAALVAAAH